MTRRQQANLAAVVLVLCIVAALVVHSFRGAPPA